MESGEDGDCCEWLDGGRGGGGGGGGRKRRFSEEQIKSLESMFATQAKLEPRQKLQLAGELGLQPRQVAIWFQNKRARWKSKQLEREYAALRDDYDALLRSYDSLKKEKQLLLKQLEKLAELLQEPRGRHGNAGGADAADGEGDLKQELGAAGGAFCSGEGGDRFAELGDDEADLFRPLTLQPPAFTPEHQFHFHSSWPPPPPPGDQTCGSSSSQWWEFESLSE